MRCGYRSCACLRELRPEPLAGVAEWLQPNDDDDDLDAEFYTSRGLAPPKRGTS